jgi:hypothetical protein
MKLNRNQATVTAASKLLSLITGHAPEYQFQTLTVSVDGTLGLNASPPSDLEFTLLDSVEAGHFGQWENATVDELMDWIEAELMRDCKAPHFLLPAATLWTVRWDDDEEVFDTEAQALAFVDAEGLEGAEIEEVIATGIVHEAHDYRRTPSLLGTFAEACDAAAVVANLIANGGTVETCMVKPVEVYADTYNTPVAEIGE